jgi:hypothetical protein
MVLLGISSMLMTACGSAGSGHDAGACAGAPVASTPVTSPSDPAYWTKERMASAQPAMPELSGTPGAGGGPAAGCPAHTPVERTIPPAPPKP